MVTAAFSGTPPMVAADPGADVAVMVTCRDLVGNAACVALVQERLQGEDRADAAAAICGRLASANKATSRIATLACAAEGLLPSQAKGGGTGAARLTPNQAEAALIGSAVEPLHTAAAVYAAPRQTWWSGVTAFAVAVGILGVLLSIWVWLPAENHEYLGDRRHPHLPGSDTPLSAAAPP